MKFGTWISVIGLLALLLFQRGAVYSAPRVDLFGEYDRGKAAQEQAVIVGEERARLNVSQDILEGPVVPFIDYQYANYCGGSLVVSTLMLPLVKAMGPTVWTLRLFALLGNIVALLCIFFILRRWVSLRAAVFGGLLWAAAAPGLLINSMVVWGTHVESNVLALGTLWLFLSIHSSPKHKASKRWLLGLMQGLNLYIGYQTVLAIGMLAFFDLHPKRRPNLKALLAQATGFLIGFAPWIWYNVRNEFSGFRIYEHSGTQNLVQEGAGQKLFGLFANDLTTGQWFHKAWPEFGGTWNDIYLGVLLCAALLGIIWLRRRTPDFTAEEVGPKTPLGSNHAPNPALVAGVWLLGFCLMYAFTRFGVNTQEDVFGYRYPLIAMPWLILAAGAGLDRIASVHAVTSATVWAGSLAIAGMSVAAATPGLTDMERFGVERKMDVTHAGSHALWLFASYREFPDRYPGLVRTLREERSPEAFETMIKGLGQQVQWLGADQPGFGEEQLKFAAQLRVMRERMLEALPAEMHAWMPEPGK